MPRTVVYSNMLPAIALVVLLFLIHKNPLFHRRQNKMFQLAVAVTLSMLAAVSIDYMFSLSEDVSVAPLRMLTSFLNFAAAPVIPPMLYNIFTVKKQPLLAYAPCALNAVLCALSMRWGFIFYITPENTYERGELFYIPYAICLFYLLLLVIGSDKHRKKNKRSEQFYLLFVIALLTLCMMLEIVYSYKFLTWDAVAVSLVLYYLLLNINNSITDTLTGALNRPMFIARIAKAACGEGFWIASIDLNNFKRLNDEKGHNAGDKCLQQFSNTVSGLLPKGFALYRTGGDEFAVVCGAGICGAELESLMQACRNEVNKYDIDFSYGIAQCLKGDDVERVLFLSDKAMYENKRQLKAEEQFN